MGTVTSPLHQRSESPSAETDYYAIINDYYRNSGALSTTSFELSFDAPQSSLDAALWNVSPTAAGSADDNGELAGPQLSQPHQSDAPELHQIEQVAAIPPQSAPSSGNSNVLEPPINNVNQPQATRSRRGRQVTRPRSRGLRLSRRQAKLAKTYQCGVRNCPKRDPKTGEGPVFGTKSDKKRHCAEIHRIDLDGNPLPPPITCPYRDCKRHHKGFARRGNWEDHIQTVHNGHLPENESLTQSDSTPLIPVTHVAPAAPTPVRVDAKLVKVDHCSMVEDPALRYHVGKQNQLEDELEKIDAEILVLEETRQVLDDRSKSIRNDLAEHLANLRRGHDVSGTIEDDVMVRYLQQMNEEVETELEEVARQLGIASEKRPRINLHHQYHHERYVRRLAELRGE